MSMYSSGAVVVMVVVVVVLCWVGDDSLSLPDSRLSRNLSGHQVSLCILPTRT